MVVSKAQLELQLHQEQTDISNGKLKEDNPLDLSQDFADLSQACRRGDLKVCQELIVRGVNVNARDKFDYTPLMLASLCGHYEVVLLLLESGALCETSTFSGERCLYNALTDHIRNLLLKYDYKKSANPLQPLATHISSLLFMSHPKSSDISVATFDKTYNLHKFYLSARSTYFQQKFRGAPESTVWKLPAKIPSTAFEAVMRYLYLAEVAVDVERLDAEEDVLASIDRLCNHLESPDLFDAITKTYDRRLYRQRMQLEQTKASSQLNDWFRENVIRHAITVDRELANEVQWDRSNAIFADVLLQTDVPDEPKDKLASVSSDAPVERQEVTNVFGLNTLSKAQVKSGIPIGSFRSDIESGYPNQRKRQSVLFPAHRAILIRSEYFRIMFSSSFREAQNTEHLQIIFMDCSPEVLKVVLSYLYTEEYNVPLNIAIDVLYMADRLFIEKLKTKAAIAISTLGNGKHRGNNDERKRNDGTKIEEDDEEIDVYEVLRAAWTTRVERLERFAARYLAYRLEDYIEDPEFAELIRESASRIQSRQETDSIELLDDIRFYLDERFRLRFEDQGISEMIFSNVPAEIKIPAYLRPDGQATSTGLSEDNYAPTNAPSGNEQVDDSDEFAQQALGHEILLEKIDQLLERLKLDA